MGKKKDERKRREREAARTAGCGAKHGETGNGHKGGAPLAGIAAAIAQQMGTPAGRQMIAAGLMAAAGAIAGKDSRPAGAKPVPPVPPVEPKAAPDAGATPATGPFAGETPEPPRGDAPALPPELSKIVDTVTTGLSRILAGLGKPAGDGAAPGTPPKP